MSELDICKHLIKVYNAIVQNNIKMEDSTDEYEGECFTCKKCKKSLYFIDILEPD